MQQSGDLVFVVCLHQHDQHDPLARAQLRHLPLAVARQLCIVQLLDFTQQNMRNPRLAFRKRLSLGMPEKSDRAEHIRRLQWIHRV